jgi:copper/silver efflux system protein
VDHVINARIDMLTSGVCPPVGVKVVGSNLGEIRRIVEQLEIALKDVKGTTSVFAERTTGGYFLDFTLKA